MDIWLCLPNGDIEGTTNHAIILLHIWLTTRATPAAILRGIVIGRAREPNIGWVSKRGATSV